MRATSKLLALALAAALQPAMAGVVSLDFEKEANIATAQIGDRYLASKGVSFSGDAWYLTSGSTVNGCTGIGNFLRTGSCGAMELAADAKSLPVDQQDSFILNLAGGFQTEFSFFYSALLQTSALVEIFDGANAAGKLLASSTFDGAGCSLTRYTFCDFTQGSVLFDGTALSLKVTGADQSLMMDDLSFITPTSGGQVPEPASAALALGALGAAAWARRRATR